MKRTSTVVAISAAGLGLLAAIGLQILHGGLSARSAPTRLEIMIARNARHLAIPVGARETANPLPSSEETLRAARLHFADHCATCHGNDGSGETLFGKGLYPKPPDLRLDATQTLAGGELFWII